MSRPNKKTNPSQPLYTINQKPGKEDSSFIITDDEHQTITASLPISSEVEPLSNSIDNPSQILSNPKKKPQKTQKSRVENKKKTQSQSEPKIYITSQSFDVDFKLMSQAFDEQLKECIPRWQQQENLTEDQLNIVKSLLEQAKKQAYQKVIYNIEMVGDKSSKDQIIPIELGLTNNVYRLNQMNLENLKLAYERVALEKPYKQEIELSPKIPQDQQVQVLMENGSIIKLDQYVKLQASKNLDRQKEDLKDHEKFVLKTQKNFIQCVGIYDRIRTELAQELRTLDQSKKKKQGNLLRFK